MNICFLGKYPPIQGGVCATTYWMAHGLAERGHQIHVVTNADEVEGAYRIQLAEEQGEWYEPHYPEVGGFVRIHKTRPFNSLRLAHIPLANPFVSKLAALATDTVREQGCELIFAYYFEPYAVAGYLASLWTGKPLVIRHAGSDLDRLMRNPELATTYREILCSAAGVVTRMDLVERFVGMGVDPKKIFIGRSPALRGRVFRPDAPPLDVGEVLRQVQHPMPIEQSRAFDPRRPTLGIYGKVGVAKGSFDLVESLARLQREGLEFNFLAMTQGRDFARFRSALMDSGLADRTWLLPFLPHWKVPEFLCACTAVCFLERDFPIKIHGPMVAREILSCGRCLVLSGEIARKQVYYRDLEDGENFVLVEDPKDHAELAGKLREIVQDPERAAAIGRRGRDLVADTFEFPVFIDQFEQLFTRCVGGPASRQASQQSVGDMLEDGEEAHGSSAAVGDRMSVSRSPAGASSRVEKLVRVLPWTRWVFGDSLESLVDEYGDGLDDVSHPYLWARSLWSRLAEGILAGSLSAEVPFLEDVVRFQQARWQIGFENGSGPQPAFASLDRLEPKATLNNGAGKLRPLRGRCTAIEELAYDVTPLFSQWQPRLRPISKDVADRLLGRVEKKPTLVYFHRAPNLLRTELRINEPTRDLLRLCDGTRTVHELVGELAGQYGVGVEDEGFHARAFDALSRLRERGVLVFS